MPTIECHLMSKIVDSETLYSPSVSWLDGRPSALVGTYILIVLFVAVCLVGLVFDRSFWDGWVLGIALGGVALLISSRLFWYDSPYRIGVSDDGLHIVTRGGSAVIGWNEWKPSSLQPTWWRSFRITIGTEARKRSGFRTSLLVEVTYDQAKMILAHSHCPKYEIYPWLKKRMGLS